MKAQDSIKKIKIEKFRIKEVQKNQLENIRGGNDGSGLSGGSRASN